MQMEGGAFRRGQLGTGRVGVELGTRGEKESGIDIWALIGRQQAGR